eukprot:tig00021319_g20262.t1
MDKLRAQKVLRWTREGKISHYDYDTLLTYGFLASGRGSALKKSQALSILVVCGLATICAYWTCRDATANPDHFDPWKMRTWKNVCFAVIDKDSALTISALVSFLLGLFVSLTFGRWWTMRSNIGVVSGRVVNISMLARSSLRSDDPRGLHARADLVRLANAMLSLVCTQAAQDDRCEGLVRSGVLRRDEWEFLEPLPSRYIMVAAWLIDVTQAAAEAKLFRPDAGPGTIIDNVLAARGAAADVFMHLSTQIPFPYVQMLVLLSRIHLLFVFGFSYSLISAGIAAQSAFKIAFGYVVLVANMLLYNGLLQIHGELSNPFGRGATAFPSQQYQDATSCVSRAAAYLLPPPPSLSAWGRPLEPGKLELAGADLDVPPPPDSDASLGASDSEDGSSALAVGPSGSAPASPSLPRSSSARGRRPAKGRAPSRGERTRPAPAARSSSAGRQAARPPTAVVEAAPRGSLALAGRLSVGVGSALFTSFPARDAL